MSTITSTAPADTLLNRSFVASCVSNLLFYTSVYMLIPVLPLYLVDELHTGKSIAGVILSSFTIAGLIIRPISGFLVDNFRRKPLYLFCYFFFAAYFIGYLLAGTLVVLAAVRCMHGLVFGIASTSASTLVIDSLPPGKLGRGIGIFGTTSSVAMSLGPMAGLMILSRFSFQGVFAVALVVAVVAFCIGLSVRGDAQILPATRGHFSFKTMFLAQGLPMALCVILATFLYGVIVNYLTLFARERGVAASPIHFFSLLAVGMILSRLFGGRLIDRGHLLPLIIAGKLTLIASVILFVFSPWESLFFASALLAGLGYGIVFPSYQTIFIRLARKEQRGTANSTYLTACDFGIGFAIFFGGLIAEFASFPGIFLIGALLVFLSIVVFAAIGIPHFKRHRVV